MASGQFSTVAGFFFCCLELHASLFLGQTARLIGVQSRPARTGIRSLVLHDKENRVLKHTEETANCYCFLPKELCQETIALGFPIQFSCLTVAFFLT